MPKNTIKVRVKLKGDVATLKSMITHPMETGQRKDKATGKLIPAHYIQEVRCDHNGKQIMLADWSQAISKDPYMSFRFHGAKKGDNIRISWRDNKDESDSIETKIS
ncbi:MAG: thiosulfate oxidation carrier complex protein SoxZ [Gammaproteobacteria bacterium]